MTMACTYNYSVPSGEGCLWCGEINTLPFNEFCCRVCVKMKEYEDEVVDIEIGGLLEMNKRLTREIDILTARIEALEGVVK